MVDTVNSPPPDARPQPLHIKSVFVWHCNLGDLIWRSTLSAVLIAATGMRRGEVFALRWDRVDLDAGTLKVDFTMGRIGKKLVISEPKTTRSRRPIPLSPAVVAMLRKHKAPQAAEKLRAGHQWTDTGLVFTTALGHPVEPRNLLRVIEAAAKTAGAGSEELAARLKGVGVHTVAALRGGRLA